MEARGLKDVAAIDTTTEWVYGRSPTKTQADTRAASGALPDQRGAHQVTKRLRNACLCARTSCSRVLEACSRTVWAADMRRSLSG